MKEEGATLNHSYWTANIGGEWTAAETAGPGEILLGTGVTITFSVTGTQTEMGRSDNTYNIAWGETKSSNYKVTATLGKLTVKQGSLTVTIKDAEKVYNGSEQSGLGAFVQNKLIVTGTGETITTDDYTIEGLGKDDVLTVQYIPAKGKNVGNYTGSFETIESQEEPGVYDVVFTIVNGGDIRTGNYESATFTVGKLEITKRSVTLTSESGEKPYDGTPLTKPTVTVGGDGFVEGEATDIKATGSVTTVAEGEVTNTITYTEGANFNAENYTITKSEGTLKITENTKALVITSSTKSWTYDGQTHTDEVYTVTYDGTAVEADSTGKVFTLPTGDTLTITATAEGVKDYSASYNKNNTYTYTIKKNGVDTSANYSSVTANVGTLSIDKRVVTLTSESGEKPYDGTPLTKPTVSGWEQNGDTGFVTGEVTDVKATGSVTTVADGEKTNTIVYTEGANFKADNYTITKNEGTLKITENTTTLKIKSVSMTWTYDGQTHTLDQYIVFYGELRFPERWGR